MFNSSLNNQLKYGIFRQAELLAFQPILALSIDFAGMQLIFLYKK
jgi:hypothetical protein